MHMKFRKREQVAEAVAEIQDVAAPVKGKPDLSIDTVEFQDYLGLAAKVGFCPPILLTHRVKAFLLESQVDIYPVNPVYSYLDHKFGLPEKVDGKFVRKWGWHPLRPVDANRLIAHRNDDENAHIEKDVYTKIVPGPVLETVDLIASRFPTEPLCFFVGDAILTDEEKDPFLAVTHGGGQWLIVERWDEPSFRR